MYSLGHTATQLTNLVLPGATAGTIPNLRTLAEVTDLFLTGQRWGRTFIFCDRGTVGRCVLLSFGRQNNAIALSIQKANPWWRGGLDWDYPKCSPWKETASLSPSETRAEQTLFRYLIKKLRTD